MHKTSTSTETDRKALFHSMPQYETVVARADKKINPFRLRWEQKARAKRPRKYKAYAIGAETCPGGSKLPLNLNAFIGDFSRGTRGTTRQIWNALEAPLNAIASDVTLHKDPINPRADIYGFVLDSDAISLKYGQFEKILTATRKARKAKA
jgi:hypothetical protein